MDKGLKKSWLPLAILLGIVLSMILGTIYGIDIFPKRNPTMPEEGCISILDRGNYQDTIDIVFLSTNYEDVPTYAEDTLVFFESFLEVEPYKRNKDRFNFFRIEEPGLDLGCNYEHDAVVCDPSKVKKAASICPYDYPVVLVDPRGVKKFKSHLRSSSWRGVVSVNANDDPLVFAHEAGHQMSALLDEYTWQGGTIFIEGPNCDSDKQKCSKFEDVDGSECHIGCVNNEHARPVEVGIMRDYWQSNSFGEYDEYIIHQSILEQTEFSEYVLPNENLELSPIESSQEVDIVTFSCGLKFGEVQESCEILEILPGRGYVSDMLGDDLTISNGDYSVGVSYGDIRDVLIVEGYNPEKGEFSFEYKFIDFEDVVILPREKEGGIISIIGEGGVVLDSTEYGLDQDGANYIISEPVSLNIPEVV